MSEATVVKRSITFPRALYEYLEKVASEESRTINAQTVRWLEERAREDKAERKEESQAAR